MSDAASPGPEPDAPAQEMDEPLLVHGCPAVESLGQLVVHPSRQQYVDVIRALTDDGYAMCVDLTAVDYLQFMARSLPDGVAAERFEIVVNMLDMTARRRVR